MTPPTEIPAEIPETEELFRQDGYLKQCDAVVTAAGEGWVCTDRTVFYPNGGGQPGDSGAITCADGRELAVIDTCKAQDSGALQHRLAPDTAPPPPGEQVRLAIHWARRHRMMRMHSCMHMLCAVIPAPVTGGAIHDGVGRLDFHLPEPPDREALEDRLNGLIRANHPMRMRWISDEELAAQPALVRTMSVAPPRGSGKVRLVEFEGADLQPCGGTHVAASGEIGAVRVKSIKSKGRQNRRVTVEFVEG